MDQLNMLKLQGIMQKTGVLINFSGRFTQIIIEELGEAMKRYFETEMISQNETYNVFSVFIEQTQNIKNYQAKVSNGLLKEKIGNSGIVAIGKSASGYFVSAGNLIENKDAAALAARLDKIFSLDKAGLKLLYKEQRKKELPPGSDSAGIGLIEIARRARIAPQYTIEALDEQVAFFTLSVDV